MVKKTKIKEDYLIVTHIPIYFNKNLRFVGQLWYKDLVEHLRYINSLTIAAPFCKKEFLDGFCILEEKYFGSKLKLVGLPYSESLIEEIKNFPKTFYILWKTIGKNDIIHTGFAGWPIPKGFFASLIALFKKKFLIIIIESSSWRVINKKKYKIKKFLRAIITEKIVRLFVKSADLNFFTHSGYLKDFSGKGNKKSYVIPASWINKKDILSEKNVKKIWNEKLKNLNSPLKIVFAGRLTEEKGIKILMDSIELLNKKNINLVLDIYGKGYMVDYIKKFIKRLKGKVRVNIKGTVKYGEPFFKVLCKYHIQVIPNISDEQPRNVYDSFSQALPVIASNTEGLLECVVQNKNGLIVQRGNVKSLAEAIEFAAKNPLKLKELGINAIKYAKRLTHQKMHKKRYDIIIKNLINSKILFC